MEGLAGCVCLGQLFSNMTLEHFNNISASQQKEELFKCCGSTTWSEKLVQQAPFSSIEKLKLRSDETWWQCEHTDWLEAFSHHPKIGDVKSLEKKFASTKEWASGEQSSVTTASTDVLHQLKHGNEAYEKKFGYIFIVCATGKSATEMLHLLSSRLLNSPDVEIKIAAQEQNKITHLRIDKLFS